MKKGFIGLVLIVITFNLVSCSYSQNESIGGITGAIIGTVIGSTIGQGGGNLAAIGVGLSAGAILGGVIGRSLDEVDRRDMYNAMFYNDIDKPSCHKLTNGCGRYAVIPTSDIMNVGDRSECRTFKTYINEHGIKRMVTGTACRTMDGTWRAVTLKNQWIN